MRVMIHLPNSAKRSRQGSNQASKAIPAKPSYPLLHAKQLQSTLTYYMLDHLVHHEGIKLCVPPLDS